MSPNAVRQLCIGAPLKFTVGNAIIDLEVESCDDETLVLNRVDNPQKKMCFSLVGIEEIHGLSQ